MRARLALLLWSCCACSKGPPPLDQPLGPGQARAGRITKKEELLTGLTAKASIGDFKLYNDRVAVTIADVDRASGFSPYGGGVLDADLSGARAGGAAFGEVVLALDLSVLQTSAVEVLNDGKNGEAARVQARGGLGALPLFDALLGGLLQRTEHRLEWTVDYVLEPDSAVLRIEHTLKNTGDEDVELGVIAGFFFGTGARPFLPGFGFSGSNSGASSDYYGAANEQISYIYGQPQSKIAVLFGESGLVFSTLGEALKVRARERKTFSHYLVIGDGDLGRAQAQWRALGAPPEEALVQLQGRLVDAAGAPVSGARVHVVLAAPRLEGQDYVTRALTDDEGRFSVDLPRDRYTLIGALDDGQHTAPVDVDLTNEPFPGLELMLPMAGRLELKVRDQDGLVLPSLVTMLRTEGAQAFLPSRYGELERGAQGARYEFVNADAMQVALPPGAYEVFISRGAEYEVVSRAVQLEAGAIFSLEAVLRRSVSTEGWMSSDPHVHAQLSSDSADLYPRKVRALAAANIELPVSTEHEAVGDFNPAIEALGLKPWLFGVVGTEISTTRYGHFNAFPLVRDPLAPNGGRIDWYQKPPEQTFATVRARTERPYLQVNHPRSTTIGYFEIQGLDRTTLMAEKDFSFDFDGVEVLNTCGDGDLFRPEVQDWFALLNAGRRVSATGTMDDHNAGRGELGFPVTYVRTDATRPAQVEPDALLRSYKEGRLIVSCGPFLTAHIGEAEVGDIAEVDDRVEVQVSVMAPSWMDVDRVRLLINGQVRAEVELVETSEPMRFSGTLSATIAEGQDAWAIIWASGDRPHGPWAQGRVSFGFTNPIFLDGDHDGAWTQP